MMDDNHPPSVSVILSTRDRPADIARGLPTLLAIDYPDYEIVLVDQSEDSATEQAVKAAVAAATAAGRPWEMATMRDGDQSVDAPPAGSPSGVGRLIYYSTVRVGDSQGRNQAVRLSRGEILAHTDDDCTVPPDWLSRGVATLLRDPGAGMLWGTLAPAPHDPAKGYVPIFMPKRYRRLRGWFARFNRLPGGGANCFIRRSVSDRLGGFDECLGAGSLFRSGNDLDISYRTLRAGYAVIHDPRSTVIHWGFRAYSNESGKQLLRGYHYGTGAYLSKHLRCGDIPAAYLFLRGILDELWSLARNIVEQRRLTGAKRLAYFVLGFFGGFRQPVERKHWVYLPVRTDT